MSNEIPKRNDKDGFFLVGIGLLFLLITYNLVFGLVMIMMKAVFILFGLGLIGLGIATIIKELKKKE